MTIVIQIGNVTVNSVGQVIAQINASSSDGQQASHNTVLVGLESIEELHEYIIDGVREEFGVSATGLVMLFGGASVVGVYPE